MRLGSRDAQRARAAAASIRARGLRACRPPGDGSVAVVRLTGMTNREAASAAETVFLAVPFAAQSALLEGLGAELDGKLLICCGVIWPPGSRPETSAAEEAEGVLRRVGASRVRVAAAFQTVAADALWQGGPRGSRSPPEPMGRAPEALPDVLVFADEEQDREEAAAAAALARLRTLRVGPLRGARAAEAMVGILLALNRREETRSAGISITGVSGLS